MVEELSGLTLRKFSDKNIFAPLGISDTFFADHPTELVRNRAYRYAKKDDGQYENNITNLFCEGDGGLHTTIADTQKWEAQFYALKLGSNPNALIKAFMLANSSIPVNPDDGADVLLKAISAAQRLMNSVKAQLTKEKCARLKKNIGSSNASQLGYNSHTSQHYLGFFLKNLTLI